MILPQKVKYRGKLIDVSDLKPNSQMRVLVECPVCKKVRTGFYRSVIKSSLCHSCSQIQNRKTLDAGERFGKLVVVGVNKAGYSNCVCDCGNECVVDNWALRSGKTNSCGCLRKENAAILRRSYPKDWVKEKHPNWKGGVVSERESFNASKIAKDWRVSVFERDSYTCQKCGQIGGKLNAHHIVQFAVSKESRADISNGITLCEKCHREVHKLLGKKKTKKP
jgi:hypothetical protein